MCVCERESVCVCVSVFVRACAFAPQESKEVILRLQVTNDAYNLNEYNEPWYSKKKLTHHEP